MKHLHEQGRISTVSPACGGSSGSRTVARFLHIERCRVDDDEKRMKGE